MLSVPEVDRIAALRDPVNRNLQITQSYHELSAAVAERTGIAANWCTFATWASKQAGQTIRREDLARALEAALQANSLDGQEILKLAGSAKRIGARLHDEQLRRSIWHALARAAADRAGDAVARGNRKVFEEIAREFARFGATCMGDQAYDAGSIERFCGELRQGDPPDGQQLLRQAFTRYYRALFEADGKDRAELLLLANIEIGFHEQTRLQPEIAAALDAALVDPKEVAGMLIDDLFPDRGWLDRALWLLKRLFGRLKQFDEAVESFVAGARQQLRRAITAHLMTMGFPHDVHLPLGQDLTATFPEVLREIRNADLLTFLAKVDPTPDSLRESGAVDWADLPERMHFIADMFRCYQESNDLFEPPFSPEQVVALKGGGVPGGRL